MSRHVDAAEYVLGMLPPDQLERGLRLEHEDPAFAREVRELRTVMGRMQALEPDQWEPPAPPPLRLDQITGAGDPAPAPARRSWLSRLAPASGRPVLRVRPVLAAGAAGVLLAAGVAVGLLIAGSPRTGSPGRAVASARIALAPIGPAPSGAHAVAVLGTQRGVHEVTLDVRDLPPSAKGTYYEVWMARDARHMVSLGTFDVGADRRAHVTLPVAVSPAAYPIMDVSLEPDDGSPAHSSVSVLRTAGGRLS